ncbi:hypothetical protein [uncultured Amnibacterium sp.]|uniref:hypothetical protein n=1 Tax=uncultured Amnibacterium sp. TaxID=1631851 RepID=UPI0035CB26EF
MSGLSRVARVLSVALIASSAIFASGLLLTSATNGTGAIFLPFAGAFAVIAVVLTLAQPEVHRLLGRRLIRHREALYVGSMLVGTSVALAHDALAALQGGPTARGADFLATANLVAPATAVVAVLGQVVLVARGAPRIRARVTALVLLAATSAAPAGAAWLLGPEAALGGAAPDAGPQLAVIPFAFAIGAVLVPLAAWTRRRSTISQAPRSTMTGPIAVR